MHILINPYLENHLKAAYYIEAVVLSMIMNRGNGLQAEDSAMDKDGFERPVVHWSVQ